MVAANRITIAVFSTTILGSHFQTRMIARPYSLSTPNTSRRFREFAFLAIPRSFVCGNGSVITREDRTIWIGHERLLLKVPAPLKKSWGAGIEQPKQLRARGYKRVIIRPGCWVVGTRRARRTRIGN